MNSIKRSAFAASGTLMILLGLLVMPGSATAQDESAAIKVGTYELEEVAQQSDVQDKMREAMTALQQRMQAAQQTGDQQQMQQIQLEASQVQQKVVDDFRASITKVLPEVAKEAGVQVIAADVGYTAAGIESVDLTKEVIAKMGGAAPAEAGDDAPEEADGNPAKKPAEEAEKDDAAPAPAE